LGDRDGTVVSFLPRDGISSLLLVGCESKGDSLLVSDGVGVRASWFSVEFGLNLYVLLEFFLSVELGLNLYVLLEFDSAITYK
jgi:hypothetical protein